VCDSPTYFYNYIGELLEGLGSTPETLRCEIEDLVRIVDAKGLGYAINTEEELEIIKQVIHG